MSACHLSSVCLKQLQHALAHLECTRKVGMHFTVNMHHNTTFCPAVISRLYPPCYHFVLRWLSKTRFSWFFKSAKNHSMTLQGAPYVLGRPVTSIHFYHLHKRIKKQMIPHLKALIESFLNQERNWMWHHPGVGHTHLIEKVTPLLKLVCSLSW